MAMGMRYDPVSWRFWVALLTIAASRRPMVIASWYEPTITPRIHFGAVSDWYMGTDWCQLDAYARVVTMC